MDQNQAYIFSSSFQTNLMKESREEKRKRMKAPILCSKWFLWFCFLFAGWINGIFGAGGGMVLPPALRKSRLEQHQAHATSLCVTLILSAISAGMYLAGNRFSLHSVLPYLPGGLLGAVVGAMMLQKIPPVLLRRAFGLFVAFAGGRLLFK